MNPVRLDAHSRAAYAIALHAIREHILMRDYPPRDAGVFISARLTWWLDGRRLYLDTRMERARAALWLRAVLRATSREPGSFGYERPIDFDERGFVAWRSRTSRRITPFWERARPHAG